MLLIFSDFLVLCHGMPQPDLACPGMKGMKKGRASDIDEARVEKVMAAGESGISWTKRLLNTCMRQGKVPEEWRTMLTVQMEGRCARPWEIQRHHTSKSHHKAEN